MILTVDFFYLLCAKHFAAALSELSLQSHTVRTVTVPILQGRKLRLSEFLKFLKWGNIYFILSVCVNNPYLHICA